MAQDLKVERVGRQVIEHKILADLTESDKVALILREDDLWQDGC